MQSTEDIFREWDKHLMEDDRPSIYFKKCLAEGYINKIKPFQLIFELVNVPQSPEHHPEGSVWNHTMMVVDNAAHRKDKISKKPRAFMWAALLHDIGKIPTTKLRKGRYTAYDHDKVGENMAIEFLKQCGSSEDFIEAVSKLVRWHMQTLFVVKDMPYADVDTMLKEVDLQEVAELSLCDRLGRGGLTEEKFEKEKENVKIFIEKCSK